jgi:hypothetical protein
VGDWENPCPVLALHLSGRVGLSWAGVSHGRCSICDAEDFCCDHVTGRFYEGQLGYRIVYQADLEEISLTPRPDDPSCFRVHFPKTKAEVEAYRGRPLRPRESPMCGHCRKCSGREGPAEDDLDPRYGPTSLWVPKTRITLDGQVERDPLRESAGLVGRGAFKEHLLSLAHATLATSRTLVTGCIHRSLRPASGSLVRAAPLIGGARCPRCSLHPISFRPVAPCHRRIGGKRHN